MNLQNITQTYKEFFDYVEENIKKSNFILIGNGNITYLQEVKVFWNLLEEYGNKEAHFLPIPSTEAYYIKFRGITAYIEVCFKNEKSEFYKIVLNTRKKIFGNKDKFVDLDDFEDSKESDKDFTKLAEESLIKAIGFLREDGATDEEIRYILNGMITQILEN